MTKQPIERVLSKNLNNKVYVFIGNYPYYTKAGSEKLAEFVKEGNTAFISTPWVPTFIYEKFPVGVNDSKSNRNISIYKKNITLNFSTPSTFKNKKGYRCYYKYVDSVYEHEWAHIYGKFKDSERLGYIAPDLPNFIRIPYGKGFFYIHTTPLVFTNYHLCREEALEYAERVFSFLPEGNIYWDEFSKIPVYSDKPPKLRESPLVYILSQPGLRVAWYTLLTLTLLWLIFTAKRRQRIIPVLEENNNTSLELAETIGQLYLSRRNHKKLLELKMKLFTEFIRNRYKLIFKELTEEFIKILSVKSQVPFEETLAIFKLWSDQQYEAEIPAELLVKFHNLTENFRKKCK